MIEDFKAILTRLEQEELRISNIVDTDDQARALEMYKHNFSTYTKEFKNQLHYSSKYIQSIIVSKRKNKK